MSCPADLPLVPAPAAAMTGALTLLFALSIGIIVVSLYAAQPLVGLIGPSLGLGASAGGLVTTVTLLGYAVGLVLLVPLCDLVENRRLILATLAANVAALAFAAMAPGALLFLVAAFAVGVTSCAIQMLVPVAAYLAPERQRGRVVGNVMSGLMLGILLSRPFASLTAQGLGWRAVYGLLALFVGLLGLLLAWLLPGRRPAIGDGYGPLIRSMGRLLLTEPVLRRRAGYQVLLMAAFNLFWTAIALELGRPPFEFGAYGIALFALAGAGGAVIAPIAGRAGDRGWSRPATRLAHGTVLAALALAGCAGSGACPAGLGLPLLVLAAVSLDMGAIGDLTLGRRKINLLNPAARGRINGLFTGLSFCGAAAGAGLAGPAWNAGGWPAVTGLGMVFAAIAWGLALVEPGDALGS
ncbi:MAG TPA: MFS transporter [Aliidongia sp.]|uniref:MFS transporter n=1 Tax=Aliidongia sp. TaxID=1914230 RepID=UPI002DDDAF0F|nr:MFS transporter [Aliidongia sp.]HEV2675200.1 MFS transporter [Aliidongia sp.]